MTDIYYTWFGPPAPANKSVSGVADMVRPDVFGLLQTARARFMGQAPPRFKWCCLRQYAVAYRAQLPDYVDVVAIEDQFDSRSFAALSLSKPNTEDLGLSVDFILRETIAFRGNRGLDVKQLAFCKDIWSLYVLWKFGGYHLDCGCFPAGAGELTFEAPKAFGVVTERPESRTFPHVTVQFPNGGKTCATLVTGNNVLAGMVLAGATKALGNSGLKQLPDVWMLRSPPGDRGIQVALEFYVRGWFAIREAELAGQLTAELRAQALRELVVSAVATGMTHSGPGQGCRDSNGYRAHVIEATFSPPRVDSMNIRKVGYASHR